MKGIANGEVSVAERIGVLVMDSTMVVVSDVSADADGEESVDAGGVSPP